MSVTESIRRLYRASQRNHCRIKAYKLSKDDAKKLSDEMAECDGKGYFHASERFRRMLNGEFFIEGAPLVIVEVPYDGC